MKRTQSDELKARVTLFQRIKKAQLDKIYYSEDYISGFFSSESLLSGKLVSSPIAQIQSKNIVQLRAKFKLGEEYQEPFCKITARVSNLAEFLKLIEEKYSKLRVEHSEHEQFLSTLKSNGKLKLTAITKSKSTSIIETNSEVVQLILEHYSNKPTLNNVQTFSALQSSVTNILCQSIFAYLNAIPLLDASGNLLENKTKIKLVGVILVVSNWNLMDNNDGPIKIRKKAKAPVGRRQVTKTYAKRIKSVLQFDDNYLEKIYKKIHKRLTGHSNPDT
jgi:uncharacterized protein YqiB (DUF1249 family)